MANGRLELKIVKDSNGKPIELDNMSLYAAKALNTFLNSLIQIIEGMDEKDRDGIRIQIVKGSACVVASGPETKINVLENDFDEVADNTSSKKDLVHNWKFIQKTIIANGLDYEINFYDSKNVKRPVVKKLKESHVFRVKTTRKKSDTNISFLKGKLMEIGGLKPNFHLFHNDIESIIHCDEVSAQKINKFLYQEISISTWAKVIPGSKPHYTYCDLYVNQDDFVKEIKTFINGNKKLSESEEFVSIHDKFKSYIDNQDFGRLKKIMRLYDHTSTDVSTLKSILVITKSFKKNEQISGIRQSIKDILEKKIGHSLI